MAGRYLKKRKRGWYFVLEIPTQYRRHFDGRARIEQTLETRDETLAEAKAKRLAGEYKLRFLALGGNPHAKDELNRAEYDKAFQQVQAGEVHATGSPDGLDPVSYGVELEIDRIVDQLPLPANPRETEEPEPDPRQAARIAGLMDGLARRQGQPQTNRAQYEPPFREVADRWFAAWKAAPDRRISNTDVQYAASIRLFTEFWGARPLREVQQRDGAEFVELLRRLPPRYGRGKLKNVPIRETVALFAGQTTGLSSAAIKRHLGVLKQIWEWAKPLGHCSGDNPFQIKVAKQKVKPSLAWESGDLSRLLASPPHRRDIYEAFHIALFTGLRINEVADMTWGQVRKERDVDYLQVEDAKTEAGHRKVPLHSKLAWLLEKKRGEPDAPIFPTFNPEGPGLRRGADASRMFGAWKRGLGFTSSRYVFHSARKNVTAIMEENSIPANQWARIIGHEPGFTFKVYNPHGLSLPKAKEIIELIDYPEVEFQRPEVIYGDAERLPKEKKERRKKAA
ncbi:tyrosine-type recombinase/integrase [Sphingosinicella microcystinivorans]|uniref:Phage integrase family protein n=1 Tax=Sphingosinicella microcystinivorans TaxID=335406 RepID=A0AAD1D879_SPHMI|nr:DUF6538 domain-containing protein [Sphingosinicella microcystinivorans]RKS86507.1 phage integrase family protein [Sphingosinicella microcystinivorans]BBE35389.1 hypothetical protein SmB9_30470 [Sphingosinicella microcystinivorans]